MKSRTWSQKRTILKPHPYHDTPSRVVRAAGALASCLAAFGLAEAAHADVGRAGDLAIGAERVFGLTSTSTEGDGVDANVTHFSLMWSGATGSPYSRPRAAIDYFVIDHLSLGGSLGFYSWSQSQDGDDAGDGSGFLFSPRVGYLIGINQRLGFWPRGGFTFVSDSFQAENGNESHDTASALSLEAPLIIMLAGGIALNVAFTIDLGLGGEVENENPGGTTVSDQEHDEFGVQLGLTGFL